MLSRLGFFLLLLCGLAQAQTPEPSPAPSAPTTVLLIPIEVVSKYQPVPAAEFTQAVAKAISEVDPQLVLSLGSPVPGAADIVVSDAGKDQALAQARAKGVLYVVWGNVEFKQETLTLNPTGGPGPAGYPGGGSIPTGTAYRYLVTVKGYAKLSLADVSSGEVLVSQPEAVWRSATTPAPQGSAGFERQEDALGRDCALQLSQRIIVNLRSSAQRKKASQ